MLEAELVRHVREGGLVRERRVPRLQRLERLAGLLAGAEPPKGLPPSRGARGPSVPPVAAALLRTAGPDAEAATTAKPAASNAVASRETAQASAAAGPQSSEMARCVPCHAPVVWELGRGYI